MAVGSASVPATTARPELLSNWRRVSGNASVDEGTFMARLLSFLRMQWEHEPLAALRQTESADKSDALQTLRAVRRRPAVAKRLERVRLQRRFPIAGSDSIPGQ